MKNYFNKKSQAAMEFLMTYGWAILVVVTVVAALAYFGVLSPSRFFPNKCIISAPGLHCGDYKVSYEKYPNPITSPYRNILRLYIRNGGGHNYQLNTITIQNSPDFGVLAPFYFGLQPLNNGDTYTIVEDLQKLPPLQPNPNKKITVNFVIEVINPDTGLLHTYDGELTTTIS